MLVAVAFSVQTLRTEIAKRQRAVTARAAVVVRNPVQKSDLGDTLASKSQPTERTRAAVAKEFGVPERKLISLLRGRVYERTKKQGEKTD